MHAENAKRRYDVFFLNERKSAIEVDRRDAKPLEVIVSLCGKLSIEELDLLSIWLDADPGCFRQPGNTYGNPSYVVVCVS